MNRFTDISSVLIGTLSAILAIVVSALTIVLFFRKKQFSTPNLMIGIYPALELANKKEFKKYLNKKEQKIIRNCPLSTILYLDNSRNDRPYCVGFPIYLENSGKESIKSLRLQIEYSREHFIDNKLLESMSMFDPITMVVGNNSETIHVIRPKLTKEEIKKMIQAREAYIFGNKAVVSYDIPLLRPGEILVVPEPLIFKGMIIKGVQEFGFGDEGFVHIVNEIKKIKEVLDYLVVNIFVHAENYSKINMKYNVYRVSSKTTEETNGILTKVCSALWLGSLPKPGIYFSDPFVSWVLKKLGYIGREGRDIGRKSAALIVEQSALEIKTKAKLVFKAQNIEDTAFNYGVIYEPNCDYYSLPKGVSDNKSLIDWLGYPSKPLIKKKNDVYRRKKK